MENGRKTNKKKKILTILFILFNVAVIAGTAISEFSGGRNASRLRDVTIRWRLLIPAALCWLLAMTAETAKYVLVMKKTCGRADWRIAARTVLLGRYYDNITPSGIGGQPFQVYYMNKCGLPAAQAATVPLAGFLSGQYAFILLALIVFIFGGAAVRSDVIRISSYVGLLFYAFFPTVILAFTFFPKTASKILAAGTRLLGKLHIVKDCDAAIAKVHKTVDEYSGCFRSLIGQKALCAALMLLSLIYQAAICSIPYFVLRAFGGDMPWTTCFITTISIYAAITFIPTPGNAGAAEGSFYLVFSALTDGHIFWAMLTWRFFSYYIFILIGALIYLERYLKKRRASCSDE